MYIHYIAINSRHNSDYIQDKPNGIIDTLFLYIKTPCTLILDEHIFTIVSPSVVLIGRNTPFKYFPTASEYVDDYLHFTPDDYIDFVDKLTYPLNTPIKISNDMFINETLHLIHNEHIINSLYYKRNIATLIEYLMLKVGEQYVMNSRQNVDTPHYHDLSEVRNLILSTPNKNWTIEELAMMAHLSPAYFQVLYKKAFGVTCITDVIQTKINEAKLLLSSTDLKISQVAQELGYNEVYHFIRQFKKTTGLTPGSFRRKACDTP